MAGSLAAIPSAALRSANLHLIGSGQGSATPAGYLAEFPTLIEAIANGQLGITVKTVPLLQVEQAWTAQTDPSQRIVLVPTVD